MDQTTADLLTSEQGAAYLHVSRTTIDRYIRSGKLRAFRIGRSYRIPRWRLNLFLIEHRTRPDFPMREYSPDEIADFLARDELDPDAAAVARRFWPVTERAPT
jgi:excisionase family DNA binding protein